MRLFGEERKQRGAIATRDRNGSLGANVVGERHALPRSCTTFSGGRAFTALPSDLSLAGLNPHLAVGVFFLAWRVRQPLTRTPSHASREPYWAGGFGFERFQLLATRSTHFVRF